MEILTIPVAVDFRISESGEVYDSNGILRNQYVNGDGYKTVAVRNNDGSWETYGVHRLVAMTFIENTDPDRNRVNHFDMNKENNHRSNLEWVTERENQIHAELYSGTNSRKRLVVRSKDFVRVVSNLAEAYELSGVAIRKIWDIVKGIKTDPNWSFEYLGQGMKIPPEAKLTTIPTRDDLGRNPKRKIWVKDLMLNSIKAYESISEAAKELGVLPNAVRHAIMHNDKLRSLKRRFLVVEDGRSFPDVTMEDILASIRNLPKSVIAYHIPEKKWYIFPSVVEFLVKSKLPKKFVRGRLTKGVLKTDTDWVFMYKIGSGTEMISRISSFLGIALPVSEGVQTSET